MRTLIKTLASVLLLSTLAMSNSLAQDIYATDVSGTALRKDSKYSEVEGTPFLFADWKEGSIIFSSNKIIKSIPLKYNVESGEVYFKSPQTGSEMLFNDAVRSFAIDGNTYQAGFNPIDANSKSTFYQVLGSNKGKLKLLKKVNKSIMEVKEYNSPNRRVFNESFTYYVANEHNTLTKVKKDNGILSQFGEKSASVKEYVSKSKLSFKKDEDLAKIFDYYNSL